MSRPECWCWQWGRCLTADCPTAGHPRPVPFTDKNWKPAALALQQNVASQGLDTEEGSHG